MLSESGTDGSGGGLDDDVVVDAVVMGVVVAAPVSPARLLDMPGADVPDGAD